MLVKVRKMVNINTQDLADRARSKCGLYLHLWGIHSPEFNDFAPDGGNYVRAVHNIRNPQPGTTFKIASAIRSRFGKGVFGEEGLGNKTHFAQDSDIVVQSVLPVEKYIKYTEKVRREGILGLLGFKEEVAQGRTDCTEDSTLNKEIMTEDTSPAYATVLEFKADVTDGMGRPTHPAQVAVIGSEQDTYDTFRYLQKNPGQYADLVKSLFPRKQFPNTNKYILDKMNPKDSIVFVDVPTGETRKLVRNN